MTDLGLEDARIRLDGERRDCFVCGHRVEWNPYLNDPHYVSSPKAGHIQLAAHGSCLNGLEPWDLAARYQRALWAALVGKKERMQDGPRVS